MLHRVISVRDDGYLIRGDNTYAMETVPNDAVIGVLTGFVRKGRQYSVEDPAYRRYVRLWNAVYPLRFVCFCCRRLLVKIARVSGIKRFPNRKK